MPRRRCRRDCLLERGCLHEMSALVVIRARDVRPSKYSIMRRKTETSAFRCRLSKDRSSRKTSASSSSTTSTCQLSLKWSARASKAYQTPISDQDRTRRSDTAHEVSKSLCTEERQVTHIFNLPSISANVTTTDSVKRLLRKLCDAFRHQRC